MNGAFGGLDWTVLAAILLGTTLLGHRLAGRQTNLRDFFLGGRRLPWYAVAASIVATEISAVTFVSLPSVVWRDGGNLTYLQIGLFGSLVARLIIAWVLVPAYYAREIFSPYDYIGDRLGEGARRMTTALFTLGGLLGQSARVYMTALVLEVVLHEELAWVAARTGLAPLASAVLTIGLVAVLWTWMGGIATVVWTDAILFLLFLAGVAVALVTIDAQLEGGLVAGLGEAARAGKLKLFDFEPDFTRPYTFWAAVIASSWAGVGQYGTDQLMAQRLFCCRDVRAARRAILGSFAAVGVIFAVALIGAALWAYTNEHPFEGASARMLAEKPDRVFPLFVLGVVPAGWKGLVLAGAFAAAISSLDSILAALSQTSLTTFWKPLRQKFTGESEGRDLLASRTLVLFWGTLLCALAIAIEPVHAHYASVLDLALSMATYGGGALLAGFVLALRGRAELARGFLWSAPLSVVMVFALAWHDARAQFVVLISCVFSLALWLGLRTRPTWRRGAGRQAGWAVLRLGLAWLLIISIQAWAVFPNGKSLAWPWFIPAGSLYTFVFAHLLSPPSRS